MVVPYRSSTAIKFSLQIGTWNEARDLNLTCKFFSQTIMKSEDTDSINPRFLPIRLTGCQVTLNLSRSHIKLKEGIELNVLATPYLCWQPLHRLTL
jgi:hypothetical protein